MGPEVPSPMYVSLSQTKAWALEPSTNEQKRNQMKANELPREAGMLICVQFASLVLGSGAGVLDSPGASITPDPN